MLKITTLKNRLEKLTPHPEVHTYLLAVSGGADSMALAHCFNDLQLHFQIAHVNHGLRGEDSDLDQKTVEDFCSKNTIKLHLYKVSEQDQKPENSVQLWARELRYAFFKQIQSRENLEFLVTAHHLNDQLETFIINLSKASGINGLSGIPANDNHILRPFLPFTKDEIYEFAKENQIEYREDISNTKNDYLRNKIRLEVVPKLLEVNENFLDNFKKSIYYINQTKDFTQKKILEIESKLTIFNKYHKILSKEKLSLESDFVKFEILKKYGFNREEEIIKIFKSENGSSFFSKEYQLVINYDELILIRKMEDGRWWFSNNDTKAEEIILIEKFDFQKNQIAFNLEDYINDIEEINNKFEWEFDAEKLQFPLRLRRHQDGDEFYPAGFSGKKKVGKFFRDEKLSILARQKIWILSDRNNKVLGIIPYRQDKTQMKNEKTKFTLKFFN
ncbi:tRNA(Ile)-lysidine synthase [Chryseobacterium sp. RU37D]|uniref:tRNA lysidine(34) synthetase TilS n=1 Tax=Chryseobacterium sp. RU37D TaxID=1907397 RepID=UPI000955A8FF|nr:tRNA lysidine(34) synthetase TilS [Chryseobacterium sp. RU37D]SIP98595.1 tRNA(Ile)-lysidine synthase [Chryseobacterium sp. RU37D]